MNKEEVFKPTTHEEKTLLANLGKELEDIVIDEKGYAVLHEDDDLKVYFNPLNDFKCALELLETFKLALQPVTNPDGREFWMAVVNQKHGVPGDSVTMAITFAAVAIVSGTFSEDEEETASGIILPNKTIIH